MGQRGSLPEEEPEPRRPRAERRLGCDRDVDLQAAGEEKDAIERTPAPDVEEVDGLEFLGECACPVVEHVLDGYAVAHGKCQVEVRPGVAVTERERTHDGARDDSVVGVRQFEHAVADEIARLG